MLNIIFVTNMHNVLYNEKNELVYVHQDNLRGVQDGKMMRDDTESF